MDGNLSWRNYAMAGSFGLALMLGVAFPYLRSSDVGIPTLKREQEEYLRKVSYAGEHLSEGRTHLPLPSETDSLSLVDYVIEVERAWHPKGIKLGKLEQEKKELQKGCAKGALFFGGLGVLVGLSKRVKRKGKNNETQ